MDDFIEKLANADLKLQAKTITRKKEVNLYFFDDFLVHGTSQAKVMYADIDEIVVPKLANGGQYTMMGIYKKDLDSIDVFLDGNELEKFTRYTNNNPALEKIVFENNREDREIKARGGDFQFELRAWLLAGVVMMLTFGPSVYFDSTIGFILSFVLTFGYMYYVGYLRMKRRK